ncbi:hypothetical protein IWX49DRAFT_156097 [Phyllosticta citricarpa]|uniref:Uncharacterized protein n=2 Tax=Phyllosticta TaxID=121621 RepID=A0ABR1MHS4_9PEZI
MSAGATSTMHPFIHDASANPLSYFSSLGPPFPTYQRPCVSFAIFCSFALSPLSLVCLCAWGFLNLAAFLLHGLLISGGVGLSVGVDALAEVLLGSERE